MAPKTRNPALAAKIEELKLTIRPIVPLPTGGTPAPDYPHTVLHFWLLTERQLNEIAHFYDQSTPTVYTDYYPAPMGWDKAFFERLAGTEWAAKRMEIKRRKLGKFIGLRGCETPVEEIAFKLQLLEAEMAQSLRRVENGMLPQRKFI
ncbi:MAG: hypothetical protein M1821_008428 [Bathelium mastoideum]|nr:MAG: hypothetical protein M1821_008428 [Bathelium mastoideum]KAI9687098.1 MAG: hypothetical protein M1822_002508 [Bathelium mastoideum]